MKPRHSFRGVVLRNAPPAARPRPQAPVTPATARVRVGREVAGRGGKGVTVVSGLTLDAAQLEDEHRDRLVAELCRLGFEAKRAGG